MEVSRAPVRDALMELEREGLVERRLGRRYVIELTARDVRELYQVRGALETMSARLAARNACPENREALSSMLEAMRTAVAQQDRAAHVRTDVEMHWLIWRQADNRHLLKMLGSMVGPVFMFVANNADAFNWRETLALHEELTARVNAGDEDAAAGSMQHHIETAASRSLRLLGVPSP
jgi:DNA-binding GntR family transcriptional regulator